MPAVNIGTTQRDPVEVALPHGKTYPMPLDWAESFRSITLKESPTSITSFVSCPLRWYMERYSDLPSGESGFAAVVGTFVHRVLEVFYSEPASLRTNKLLWNTFWEAWNAIKQRAVTGIIPSDLQQDFDKLVDAADNPDGFLGGFCKRAKTCIEAIVNFDGDPAELDVDSTEQWVRTTSNGVLIRGKIDRKIVNDFGRIIIQDYKTGRVPEDEDHLYDEDGNELLDAKGKPIRVLSGAYIPVGLYALMSSRGQSNLGGDSVGAVQLLYLANAVKYNFRITEDTLDLVQRFVDSVTQMMLDTQESGVIMCQPADSPEEGQCGWCPVSGICPAWSQDGDFAQIRFEMDI